MCTAAYKHKALSEGRQAKMGKCNFALPSWNFSQIREIVSSYDAWDIAGLLFQIPLQTLFLLGTLFLTVQITWMRLRAKVSRTPKEIAIQLPKRKTVQYKDFTLKELAKYNGVSEPEGDIIYVAVNGKVFDVSSAKNYYGPGCSYAVLAGRDVSRAFATFSLAELTTVKENQEPDDLSDLNPLQLDSLYEWEMQFAEKYTCVGRIVRYHQPGRLEDLCTNRLLAFLEDAPQNINKLPLPTRIKQRLIAVGETYF